ncbi:cobalamin-binding protein [Microbulbifer elongatus]|uniref:Cobalamin-binding protein n=1 Tax=Microbulbifer elongatus TaxID=86173 RepID=A0ABT1P2F5_9GAMM|nr:cobalamin-binding protein [Microbulbifer elongatus]MCQ3830308.1 cobalamin-binding protein [Microbulbifer elongatus]
MSDNLVRRNSFSPAAGLLSAIGFLLVLCASSAIAGQPVRILDASGHWLELPRPAQRIVALAPHIVENLYSAGAGDRLIGVISHSDFPAAARQLPQVGNYNSISYETLIALKPDLVIAWGSGNGDATITKLRDFGFRVFVTESRTLEDIPRNVRLFGTLAGTQGHANRAADRWLSRLRALRQAHETLPAVSVLYQVWHDPLQTLNGDHLISDVIEACGGRNAFADAAVLAPKISIEAVLARNPEVIIASGMAEARPQWLNNWNAYPGLSAVNNENLYHIHPDVIQRHTFRILDGMEQVCRNLNATRAKRATQNRSHTAP